MKNNGKKYGIIAAVVVALMVTMHLLVNNLDILSAIKHLHGG